MNNKKVKILLENGFSIKTIRTLSESEINILVKKVIKEGTIEYPNKPGDADRMAADLAKKGYDVKVIGSTKVEVGENEDDLDALARQDYTGQKGPHDYMAPDGMDDDSDNDRSMMENDLSDEEIDLMLDIIQTIKENEKGKLEEKFQSKSQQKYFSKLPEKVKEENLKSLEESVMRIVQKHLPPSITKGDLVKLINEAPLTKPAPVKPDVAPSRPERKTPFQPKHKPKPKAGKELPDWMSYSEIFESEPFTKPAPVKPDVAPSKPERKTPFQPKHKPKPKAEK